MNGCRLHAPPRLPRRVPIDRSDALRRSINQWTIDLYGAVGAGRVDQDQPTDCLQSESRPYPEGALRDGCLGGPPQPLAPPTHHCITAVHQNAHASSSYFRRYRIQPSLPLSHSFFPHSYVICSIPYRQRIFPGLQQLLLLDLRTVLELYVTDYDSRVHS